MPSMHPSKNTKCPCGSGKKYRKCHGAERRLLAQMAKKFREQERSCRDYQEKHGYARPPVSTMMGNSRMVAIGGSIYKQTQEGPYGFMNLLHDCGIELFGTKFLEDQELKPFEERHPALQWMYIYVDNHQKLQQQGQTDPAARQIGAGGAWFRFGYDLFTIRDNSKLQQRLKERLLITQDFQAARHELAVAAMCIAAGYEIDFEDETDNSTKHPEFIATHKLTGKKIAVEAKSRRRWGVKGFSGGHEIAPGHAVGIRGLVVDGFKKISTLPLYIFVDVNLPNVHTEDIYTRWLMEIDKTMTDLENEGYASPSPANAIFFTNDPSHYVLQEEIRAPGNELWFKPYLAATPKIAHPSDEIVPAFLDAFTARIAPPKDFPAF